jgi:hypothetical protein
MTSNGHASGSTDGTPTISSRSTYPHDNWRSQMATSTRSWSATGSSRPQVPAQACRSRQPTCRITDAGLVPGQFRRGGRTRTTEETMRHGCQDTARADTAGWA